MKLLSKILLFSISRIYETTFACSLENCDLQVDDNGSNVCFVSRFSKLVFTMPVQLVQRTCIQIREYDVLGIKN